MVNTRFCPKCRVRKLRWSRAASGKVYWGKTCERCSPGRRTVEEIFWGYVEKGEGCWLWRGATVGGGYGKFMGKPPRLAHRFSYELHKGVIPKGLFVCHHCDIPRCVNPAHLFVGTNRDNQLDAKRKGRLYRNGTKSEEVYKLRCLGISWRNIGRFCGVYPNVASSMLKQFCRVREIPEPRVPVLESSRVPVPGREPKSRLREGTLAQRGYELKKQGLSWRVISIELGWSDDRQVRNQVRSWCLRRGVEWPIS